MVKPTEKEIIVLFTEILKSPNDLLKSTPDIGSLLGMKLVDSFLPEIIGMPKWDYDGLVVFCDEHGIKNSDSIGEALKKLTNFS